MAKMKSPRYVEFVGKFSVGVCKALGMVVALYFFICSLTFLSTAFRQDTR